MVTLMYYLAFKLLQNHQIYTCKCLPTKSRVNTSGNIIKKTYASKFIAWSSMQQSIYHEKHYLQYSWDSIQL